MGVKHHQPNILTCTLIVSRSTELTLVKDALLVQQALHVGHPLIKVRHVTLAPFQKIRAEPVVNLSSAVSQQHADPPNCQKYYVAAIYIYMLLLHVVFMYLPFVFRWTAKLPFPQQVSVMLV